MREWRRKNREKIRQYKKEYYRNHRKLKPRIVLSPEEKKQRMNEYIRSWRAKNKEKLKAYRIKHLDLFQKRARQSYYNHRQVRLEYKRQKDQRNREIVLLYYSHGQMECACCGSTDKWSLSIDHIANNGKEERKQLKIGSGAPFYAWLIRHGFPEGYQVLCRNCNWGKRRFGKCPHQLKKA